MTTAGDAEPDPENTQLCQSGKWIHASKDTVTGVRVNSDTKQWG